MDAETWAKKVVEYLELAAERGPNEVTNEEVFAIRVLVEGRQDLSSRLIRRLIDSYEAMRANYEVAVSHLLVVQEELQEARLQVPKPV